MSFNPYEPELAPWAAEKGETSFHSRDIHRAKRMVTCKFVELVHESTPRP